MSEDIVKQVKELMKTNEQFPPIVEVGIENSTVNDATSEWATTPSKEIRSLFAPLEEWQKAAYTWAIANPQQCLRVSIKVPMLDGWSEVWLIGVHVPGSRRHVLFAQSNLTGAVFWGSDNGTERIWLPGLIA